MASRVVMPKLTDTMEEGVVVKWKKREGEVVGSGDVLAEIETDKAVMDLEAFASGTLRRVLVPEGTTVKAGELIAVIADPDEDIAPVLAETMSPAPALKSNQGRPTPPAPPAAQPAGEEDRVKASPRAKALAHERGIDLASVTGSGPGGRIVEEDILKAGGTVSPRTTGATDRPLSQMRKAIARTTTQSKAPVPHFYLTAEIAMDETEQLRTQLKQTRRFHPSLTDVIVKAAAMAMTYFLQTARVPVTNGAGAGAHAEHAPARCQQRHHPLPFHPRRRLDLARVLKRLQDLVQDPGEQHGVDDVAADLQGLGVGEHGSSIRVAVAGRTIVARPRVDWPR